MLLGKGPRNWLQPDPYPQVNNNINKEAIVFVVGNLIISIAQILNILLDIYFWIIVISALISWVHPDPYNPIVRFLYRATEPVLMPIRRIVGKQTGAHRHIAVRRDSDYHFYPKIPYIVSYRDRLQVKMKGA